MTAAPHRRHLPTIRPLSRRPAADVVPLPSSAGFDHRMGLVRQRRAQTGGRLQCGSAAGQRRRRFRLARLKDPRDEDLVALGIPVRSASAGDRGRGTWSYPFHADDHDLALSRLQTQQVALEEETVKPHR